MIFPGWFFIQVSDAQDRKGGIGLLKVNKKALFIILGLIFAAVFWGNRVSISAETTRYEAESCNLWNCSVSSTYPGYSGTGYVTGLTSEWSRISFDKGVDATTPAQLEIRYANGDGDNKSLEFWIGSQKIQDLVFPPTGSWSTWGTITITFDIPPG